MATTQEPRARRTHARRSCDLCKVRKTRCELPDLDVPSSSDPLPAAKSCHRCKVLALPCVVDDANMRRRKKKESTGGAVTEEVGGGDEDGSGAVGTNTDGVNGRGQGKGKRKRVSGVNQTGGEGEDFDEDDDEATGETSTHGAQSSRRTSGAVDATASASHSRRPSMKRKSVAEPASKQNHSLDLLHGFSPLQPHFVIGSGRDEPRDEATTSESQRRPSMRVYSPEANPEGPLPVIDGPAAGAAAGMDVAGSNRGSGNSAESIRLHGRPLELVSAMLGVAYGKLGMRIQRREVVGDDIDLGELVDQTMRTRLEHGFSQLRAYHPHLQTMARLFRLYAETPTPPVALLLSTSLYLSSLSLPLDQPVVHLRSMLMATVSHLRHLVLTQLPQSLYALQALEILALHAPLGPLPFQLVDPRELAPARGYVAAIRNIVDFTRFHDIMKGFVNRFHPSEMWDNIDVWLWFGIRATEGQTALEDERVKKPPFLADARHHSGILLGKEHEGRWNLASWGGLFESADLLGRLTVCDRLARLDEVHDALVRLRGALDTAAANPGFNVVQAITDEYEFFHGKMEKIDQRHNEILNMLSLPRALTSAWTSYRAIRRRFELCKVYVLGLHIFMSVHFLPGSSLSFPGLPTNLAPSQAVSYAISRSYNPSDMMAVITSTTPASDELKRWGRKRGEVAEQVLLAFAELAHTVLPGQRGTTSVFRADVIPLHEVLAIAVECAKVLMEMQAGSVIALRSIKALHKAFRIPTWLYVMRQVSEVMQSLGALCIDDGKGGESVSNGCSNLVGSMVRTADDWGKMVERESSTSLSVSSNSGGSVSPTNIPSHLRNAEREAYLSGLGAIPSPPNPSQSLPPPSSHIFSKSPSAMSTSVPPTGPQANSTGAMSWRDGSTGESGSACPDKGPFYGRVHLYSHGKPVYPEFESNLLNGTVMNEMGGGLFNQNNYSEFNRWPAHNEAIGQNQGQNSGSAGDQRQSNVSPHQGNAQRTPSFQGHSEGEYERDGGYPYPAPQQSSGGQSDRYARTPSAMSQHGQANDHNQHASNSGSVLFPTLNVMAPLPSTEGTYMEVNKYPPFGNYNPSPPERRVPGQSEQPDPHLPSGAPLAVYPMPPQYAGQGQSQGQGQGQGPVPSGAMPRTPPGIPTMAAGLGISRNLGPAIVPGNSGDNVPVSIGSGYGANNAFDALMAEMFGYGSASKFNPSTGESTQPADGAPTASGQNSSGHGNGDSGPISNGHPYSESGTGGYQHIHGHTQARQGVPNPPHPFGARSFVHPDQTMDATRPTHPAQIQAQAEAHMRAQQMAHAHAQTQSHSHPHHAHNHSQA